MCGAKHNKEQKLPVISSIQTAYKWYADCRCRLFLVCKLLVIIQTRH